MFGMLLARMCEWPSSCWRPSVEGGSAGGRAHEEAPAAGVAERPGLVARPLEAEHRVEDVERDHRQVVARVGGPGGLEARHRTGLRDPLLEDLPVLRLPG